MAIEDQLGSVTTIIGAAAALGTAAFGLVDATKVFAGGPSNFGFSYIRNAVRPFIAGARSRTGTGGLGEDGIWTTLRANWLNGMAKADQKAVAKSLIRLCIHPVNAPTLARAAGIDEAAFTAVATKLDNGTDLTNQEVTLIGRFDAVVSAALDAGYERGDQFYRNAAKACAAVVAIVLGAWAGYLVGGGDFVWRGAIIGVISTPLAPIAKDLSSTLVAAANAVSAWKR
jgi:hypothetical protein